MMENHSFDNYLGLLGRGDGLDVDANGLPTASNPRHDGRSVRSHTLSATAQTPGVPTQGWEPSHEQWASGTNQGFVRSAEHREQQLDDHDTDPAIAMGYWTDADLPFYWGLARQFPLADRWFSSCLGPTFPNRRFLIAGTANGLTSDSVSHTFDRPSQRHAVRPARHSPHQLGELPPDPAPGSPRETRTRCSRAARIASRHSRRGSRQPRSSATRRRHRNRSCNSRPTPTHSA